MRNGASLSGMSMFASACWVSLFGWGFSACGSPVILVFG